MTPTAPRLPDADHFPNEPYATAKALMRPEGITTEATTAACTLSGSCWAA